VNPREKGLQRSPTISIVKVSAHDALSLKCEAFLTALIRLFNILSGLFELFVHPQFARRGVVPSIRPP